jgi:hypothetical protein
MLFHCVQIIEMAMQLSLAKPDPPKDFTCPITHDLMYDPVLLMARYAWLYAVPGNETNQHVKTAQQGQSSLAYLPVHSCTSISSCP